MSRVCKTLLLLSSCIIQFSCSFGIVKTKALTLLPEETGELERVRKSIILGFRDVNFFDISQSNTATLIHELAHGALKHQAERAKLTKQQKEFEAETVTALLCADFGIDRKSEIYLKAWQTTAELIEDVKQI